MIRLMEELIARAPQDPGIAKSYTKSVNSMRSQLRALLLSATADDDGSRLPEKENLGPNQLSWPETATRMGVKRGGRKRQGKVDSALTSQHIGEPNRKRAANNDPYGAGEQSGKRAKPDARSAAANARVCAVKAEPLRTQPSPSTPTPLPLPASLPSPALHPHAAFPHCTFNPYQFPPLRLLCLSQCITIPIPSLPCFIPRFLI